MRSTFPFLALALAVAPSLYAQKPADHVALGVAAYQAVKPDEALQHFQAALAADSLNYEANYRAARATLDIAAGNRTTPDSLFGLAERYARRAVAVDSTRAEGHYMVAAAVGNVSESSERTGHVGYDRAGPQNSSGG